MLLAENTNLKNYGYNSIWTIEEINTSPDKHSGREIYV
jgi:hypothetical protein